MAIKKTPETVTPSVEDVIREELAQAETVIASDTAPDVEDAPEPLPSRVRAVVENPSPDVAVAQAPPNLDPWAILDRLTRALESGALGGRPGGDSDALAAALNRISALTEANERTQVRRSNEITHDRSVFNRRGKLLDGTEAGPHKRPLKCDMFIPWMVEWESCTREEVDLLNLLEPGNYTVPLNDDTEIPVEVRVAYRVDGTTPNRLLMQHRDLGGNYGDGYNQNNFRKLMPLAYQLRHVLRMHRPEVALLAAAVLSDKEEMALISRGELEVSK